MVYSLENIRHLKNELVRLTERHGELLQDLADLKRRAGLDPDSRFPAPGASQQEQVAPAPSSDAASLFRGRFHF